MTDKPKYEINRRYQFEGNTCPVDGEAVVTVWGDYEAVTSAKAMDFYWRDVTHFMVLEYPPEKKARWLNVYENGTSGFYTTRETADRYATVGRTACLKVEYTDGEGL